MFEYKTIPIIVVACYLLIQAIKTTRLNSKWYPIVSGALGAAIAVGFHFVAPAFFGFESWISALVIGVVSGLAATGSNQVYKQLYQAAKDGTIGEDEGKQDDGEDKNP